MIKILVKFQHMGGWFRVLEIKSDSIKHAVKMRPELEAVYENDRGYVGIDIVEVKA